jgi:toxin ParE1/3/4
MSLPLVFRRIAQKEFDEAAVWYEEKRAGLGIEFVDEIQKALDQIVQQPDRFPMVLDDVREAPARRFPYCVYYRQNSSRIVVLAVFHSSRDPEIWKTRT